MGRPFGGVGRGTTRERHAEGYGKIVKLKSSTV